MPVQELNSAGGIGTLSLFLSATNKNLFMSSDRSKVPKPIPVLRLTSNQEAEKFHKCGYLYKPNSITFISEHNHEEHEFLLKKNMQYLKAYEFKSIYDESEEDIINLMRSLKRLNRAGQIRLLFRKCHELTDDQFQMIMRILSMKKYTKFFKLRLISAIKLSDKGLYQIGDYFIKQKLLKKFEGFFYSMPQLNDIAFFNLGRHIRRLHTLQDLELYFGSFGDKWKYITNAGINGFISHIARLRRIQRLSLTINFFDNFDDESLFSFEKHLSKLQNLKSLELVFRYINAITETGVTKLSGLFKKVLSLTELKLEFRHCYEPSHRTIQEFANAIVLLSDLRNLSFHFENCMGIRAQTLVYLTEKLSKLEKLNRATLNFVTCGNITVIDFHPDFMKKIVDFEEFNFDFSENDKLSKNNVAKFFKSLSFKNLKRTIIKLNRLTRGDDNFISSINEWIQRTPTLGELVLSLRGYEDFVIEDLEILFDIVTQLRGIKIFKLDIGECSAEVLEYATIAKSKLENIDEVAILV